MSVSSFEASPNAHPAAYLDLLKRCVLNSIYPEAESNRPEEFAQRMGGYIWPAFAHSMAGLPRLNNVQACAETVLREAIPGDFLEAGVWRGGIAILMRGILHAYGVTDRVVWVADSFEGVPAPNLELYPIDSWSQLHHSPQLAVPLETVQQNFSNYGLLDDQVQFLNGWFRDTLPTAPIEKLALLRLDGDLYESTMDTLTHLYPKLSPGGFLIVDDYGCIPACRQAVTDYRERHGIQDPIVPIDWTGIFWRRM